RAVETHSYQLATLSQRVGKSQLPQVKIVDMLQEVQQGNAGIFSRALLAAIADRLHRQEQIILLLNRRGYSTSLVCRECGLVLKCPHCEISLTYHNGQKALCHYCGYAVYFAGTCPDCQSSYIGYWGREKKKAEEELAALFPSARILRLDADSTSRKGQHRRIYQSFKAGEADILLGTQMVSQGLDVPGVTLAGVINADTCLNLPDFRASERTFQLLTQVAGRAGRGANPGEVLIQTFSPDHYAIKLACEQDYQQFYQKEIALRRLLQYPPLVRLGRVLLWGKEEKMVWQLAEKAGKLFEKKFDLLVIGPAPAPLSKIKDRFRYHILLKAKSGQYLRNCLHQIKEELGSENARVTLAVELDPQNLM
ncbi:MAG: primosomal protein N', partial [Clostridia bacterium]|nr:primosomal protein N' [Clostridia bacterium]